MAKPKKKSSKSRDAYPKLPDQSRDKSPTQSHAFRETVESIVIAFVLAFLFRTFEAEAFVIPTGSMAPTLMGEHKDVDCSQCGHRFRVNASIDELDNSSRHQLTAQQQRERTFNMICVAGMCPNCRYTMPMQPQLPPVPELREGIEIPDQPTYTGDRILVNKYLYTFGDPKRWDVVVFHFPGDAKTNYIKRLVGLPNEVIRVSGGDLFVAENSAGEDGNAASAGEFSIARKPPDKLLAMRQLVHDTGYDPANLYEAGWPLRWQAMPADGAGWETDAEVADNLVRQRYTINAEGDSEAWLRYFHVIPGYDEWLQVMDEQSIGGGEPQLVTDFTAYNTRVTMGMARGQNNLKLLPHQLGLHWVGDLMVEADVTVESDQGDLLLDLVEAGRHFTATIDLTTGAVNLSIDGADNFSPSAETPISLPGRYHVAFANVDDQLHLWVDGKLIEFDGSTEYDAGQLFGGRDEIIPRTSDSDPGDLGPVGIGARGAKLAVTRLVIWRDIYYIATDWKRQPLNRVVTDFNQPLDPVLFRLPAEPSLWSRYRERNTAEFPLTKDQFFVMGDNSAESSDARLWADHEGKPNWPGGAYLERSQLIGKALCVYWPHTWNRIPGTPIPFPLFPNFADMRLVR